MSHSHPQYPSPSAPPNTFSLGKTSLQGISPSATHSSSRKFWRIGLMLFGTLFLGGVLIFFLLGVRLTQSLQFENTPISFFEGVRLVGQGLFSKGMALRGEETGQINILLLGRAGEHHPGKNLTDTVMILSLNTQEKRIALLSLPRDLLAPIPNTDQVTKLNSLYQYGLLSGRPADVIRESVTEMTGLPIHYFASIDFDGFERVIDDVGGINVEVLRDISDPRYPGPNYSYETFELKKGWQKLDGKTALKYARERHNDPEGDFGRAKRQQQIMQAVRERVWSLPTLANPITLTQFLNNLGESVKTDITPQEGYQLFTLAEHLDTRNITTMVVDAWKKDSLLRVTHVDTGNGLAFALVPRSGTWDEVQSLAANLFDQESIKIQRDRITQEAASLLILTAPTTFATAEKLRQDILDTFPVQSVLLRSFPPLEKQKETAMIQSGASTQKIYTLNALIGRYNFDRVESLPISLPTNLPLVDHILLFTRETIPGLYSDTLPTTEENDFQEPFPSLPKSKL